MSNTRLTQAVLVLHLDIETLVLRFICLQACVPYFEILEKWVYKGIIRDPYSEVSYLHLHL